MDKALRELTGKYQETLLKHRRYLHAHPEISYQEKETQQYLISALKALGIPLTTFPGNHSIIARLKGDAPGPVIAFRSDLDALPLQELTELPFRSCRDGVMHACGHDGHMACLMTFAEIMSRHREWIKGEILFVFQHSEEAIPGGARELMEARALEGVDAIYGFHLWAGAKVGRVYCNPGPQMAAVDQIEIAFTGSGGHGSEPHKTQDVVMAAAATALQFQSIKCSNINAHEPSVLTMCRLQAGHAFNVIPDRAEIAGTLRTFNEEVRKRYHEDIVRIARAVAEIYEVKAEAGILQGHPVLINNAELARAASHAIKERTGHEVQETPPSMIAEDFSNYTAHIPGVYFFVGCGSGTDKDKPLHSSRFVMDEGALAVALESLLAIYLDRMEQV